MLNTFCIGCLHRPSWVGASWVGVVCAFTCTTMCCWRGRVRLETGMPFAGLTTLNWSSISSILSSSCIFSACAILALQELLIPSFLHPQRMLADSAHRLLNARIVSLSLLVVHSAVAVLGVAGCQGAAGNRAGGML